MATAESRADVIVIGAGPAGLTTALYLARDQVDTVLFEKAVPGGQVIQTDRVENYPGFPDGISGPELMERLTDQVRRFGARIEIETEATAIEDDGDAKLVTTPQGPWRAPYVVIATGSDYRRLDVPGSDKLTGRGISYCAICDGALFKGKTVAVIGGGGAAVDEATFLTKFVDHIYLLQRSARLKAERVEQDAMMKTGKVDVLLEHEVRRVTGDAAVTGIDVLDRRRGEVRHLELQGVFVFIGRDPNTDFVKGYVDVDEEGFIITSFCSVETSRRNVFAVGDVRAGSRAQITTAVGEGTIAAFFIRHRLEEARRRPRARPQPAAG